jgi:hypothetical protein
MYDWKKYALYMMAIILLSKGLVLVFNVFAVYSSVKLDHAPEKKKKEKMKKKKRKEKMKKKKRNQTGKCLFLFSDDLNHEEEEEEN